MEPKETPDDVIVPSHVESGVEEQIAAWEQIENGRYMPCRVRGSCQGRELG